MFYRFLLPVLITTALWGATAQVPFDEALHIATTAVEAGDFPTADRYLSGIAAYVAKLPELDNRRAIAYSSLASYHQANGNPILAERFHTQAIAIWDKTGTVDPYLAQTLTNLAAIRIDQNRWEEAEALAKRSQEIFTKALGPNHFRTTGVMTHLASMYVVKGRIAEAEPLLQAALEIQKKALPESTTYLINTYEGLATLRLYQGLRAEAESLMQTAYQTARTLPENHILIAETATHLGSTYAMNGKFDRAEPLLKSALSIYQKLLGPDQSRVGTLLTSLARVDCAQKKFLTAEEKLRTALAIFEKNFPKNHIMVGLGQSNLGEVLLELGQFDQAGPLLESALQIKRAAYDRPHPDIAVAALDLARLYAARRDQRAESLFRESISVFESCSGEKDPRLGEALNAYAGFLKADHRKKDAKSLEAKAKSIYSFQSR